ncbi:MAG: ATP-dependent nuclease [Bacilli bacterium]
MRIQNFRCFLDASIALQEKINVIIGENNAGKSTLLKALALVFTKGSPHPTIDDFCRHYIDYTDAPDITVSVTIKSTTNDNVKDFAVVATWLTKIVDPWEATLTYTFLLSESDRAKFKREVGSASGSQEYWKLVGDYIPRFVTRIYGGNVDAKLRADADWLDKFSYHILDAVRDAESNLFSGRNPLLKRALNSFLDNNLRLENGSLDAAKIKTNRTEFASDTKVLTDKLRGRLDLDGMLELANETGAAIGGKPTLEGNIDESDFISALTLMIDSGLFKLPISRNGLGYNNLIYISLILANLTAEDSLLLGENAKIFPMLAIEEPEAHLHPAMQYKLLKFLQSMIDKDIAGLKNRQLFITSHSTHITSAVSLDSIICFYMASNGQVQIAYPGKVYANDTAAQKSKKYVERYLDATKSNMLFSKGVLFVEGLAEQIILPCLADYFIPGILEDNHIAIVKVDGIAFGHFMPLFGLTPPELQPFSIRRKISCITDSDPVRLQDGKNQRKKSCFPFDFAEAGFTFQSKSDNLLNLETLIGGAHSTVGLFCETKHGKTFEYDLMLCNQTLPLLLTDSCTSKHAILVKELMENFDLPFTEFAAKEQATNFTEPFADRIQNTGWEEDEKKRALIASHYLESVEKVKGGHALELDLALRENLKQESPQLFVVPEHIEQAIRWVCEQ